MKKQRGAALVVVLSMLAMSLMLGLSGMQSAQIDERLAGNYRSSSLAQMAAEKAVSRAYKEDEQGISSDVNFYPVSRSLVESASWDSFVSGHPSYGGSYSEGNISYAYRRYRIDGASYIVGLGAVLDSDGAVISKSHPVYARLRSTLPPPPSVNGAFTCFGTLCDHKVSGNASVSGSDYMLPGDFNCSGSGCSTGVAIDGQSVHGIYYPHKNGAGEAGDAEKASWASYLQAIEQIGYDKIFTGGQNFTSNIGGRGSPALIKISSGMVTNSSNHNTSGIIVVKAGATYKMTGTGHHEGLIIVEEGGTVEEGGVFEMSSGTPRVYGAVIKMNGSSGYDLQLTGNISLRYSSAAISLLSNIGGGASGSKRKIMDWF